MKKSDEIRMKKRFEIGGKMCLMMAMANEAYVRAEKIMRLAKSLKRGCNFTTFNERYRELCGVIARASSVLNAQTKYLPDPPLQDNPPQWDADNDPTNNCDDRLSDQPGQENEF